MCCFSIEVDLEKFQKNKYKRLKRHDLSINLYILASNNIEIMKNRDNQGFKQKYLDIWDRMRVQMGKAKDKYNCYFENI